MKNGRHDIKKNSARRQYLAAAIVSIGGLAIGTTLVWSASALPAMMVSDFIEITVDQKSWIGSLLTVGALVGTLIGGLHSQYFGRKKSMTFFTLPFILGWSLIFSATELWMIYVGRFLKGLGVGAISLAAPVYLSEISKPEIRGFLSVLFQVMASLGILLTYILGSLLSWHLLSIVLCVIPVVFLALINFVPESPRYYILRGCSYQSIKSMFWLRDIKIGDDKTKEVMQEIRNIENNIKTDRTNTVTFHDLIFSKFLKPFSVVIILMTLNQFSGINAINFYTVDILHLSSPEYALDPYLASIVVGCVTLVSNIGSIFLVDRVGRKALLYFSFVTMSMAQIGLGCVFFFFGKTENSQLEDSSGHSSCEIVLSFLPLLCVMMFDIGYFVGIGSIIWTLMPELLPNLIIGITSSIATFYNWILAFLVTRFFGNINEYFGPHITFWSFGIICILGAVFTLFFVPETKGKSLEDIQKSQIRSVTNFSSTNA